MITAIDPHRRTPWVPGTMNTITCLKVNAVQVPFFVRYCFASNKEVVQGRISQGPRLCSVVVTVLKIGFGE